MGCYNGEKITRGSSLCIGAKSPLGRVLCRLGFHKWLYRLPDWGGDGHTLREGKNLREEHCPTCKCTWLQDGVMRICKRGCGIHHTWWRDDKGWR